MERSRTGKAVTSETAAMEIFSGSGSCVQNVSIEGPDTDCNFGILPVLRPGFGSGKKKRSLMLVDDFAGHDRGYRAAFEFVTIER
jgi:hypothetical protein